MSSNTIYSLPDVHEIAYYNGEDRSYYVYVYVDPRDGEPFYVGKGKNGRAWDHVREFKKGKVHPNTLFYSKLNKLFKNGLEPEVEIYADGLTEDDALGIEASLIEHYGRKYSNDGCLVNIVLDSRKAFSGVARALMDPNVYKFTHHDGTVFYGTQRDMVVQKGIPESTVCTLVKGTTIVTGGWYFGDKPETEGNFIGQKHKYINVHTGEELYCTQEYLCKTYGLHSSDVCALTKGNYTTVKGWYFDEIPERDYNQRAVKRKFINIHTDEVFWKTPEEMRNYLSDSKIYEMVEGKRNHVNGWFVDEIKCNNRTKFIDENTYKIINSKTGDTVEGTRSELIQKFPKTFNHKKLYVIIKKKTSYHGWYLDGCPPNPKPDTSDKTIYTFYNKLTGDVFNGTRKEFAQYDKSLTSKKIYKVINKGSTTREGWKLAE